MKNIKTFIIVLCLSNISYGQYTELEKCINNEYKIFNTYETSTISIIDSIKVFEDYLLKSKLLKDTKEKSYQKLIKKNISIKRLEKIIKDIKTSNTFFYQFNDGTYTVLQYNTCPYKVASSNKKMSKVFYPIVKIYNDFIATMYPSKKILMNLSCKTNYENKVSRMMLCNLIYINWKTRYGEFEIKRKKEVLLSKNTIIKNTVTNVKSIIRETEQKNNSFLFIDIGTVYFKGGSFTILNQTKDTIAYFKDKKVLINNKEYETIEESGFYKNKLNCISFDPEYDLFILKYIGKKNGFYEVMINEQVRLIDIEESKGLITLKTTEEYILEAYPKLNENTPIREQANNSSKVISNYLDFTYLPVEIKGDWLKVKDDKECFIDKPSKTDIIGWVRWRKNGEIIINIAHSC